MHDYIEWAELMKEQLHQYKDKKDFSKSDLECIDLILHAASCAYKCKMFEDEYYQDRQNRNYYGNIPHNYNYYGWHEPYYRNGESYRGNGESYRGRGSYYDNAEQELMYSIEKALPKINNPELKDIAQRYLSEMKR